MSFIKKLFKYFGKGLDPDIDRYSEAEELSEVHVTQNEFPPDFDHEETSIIREVLPYTLTSPERIYSLIQSVRYISKK